MLTSLGRKIFGSRNERIVKRYRKVVRQINDLEPKFAEYTDEQLAQTTKTFQSQYSQGKSLADLLPGAFAVVREMSKRTLQMRHFDVQLIGGMVLHYGNIAEMRTGEGKTVMATLAAYLNALSGKGVHIITVNDYLANRDANWMRPIYEGLGLSVGVIVHGMSREEKQAAYHCDIVYGTNNEFGFDYLRDNMAFSLDEKMQRELNFAIVDEVDSILIDEARTPLIISGADQDSSELYIKINQLIPRLSKQEEKEGPGDYSVDEKSRQAFLTEEGHQKIEELLVNEKLMDDGESLYDAKNIGLMHHIYAGIRAHAIFRRDVDYIIKDNQVVIVDEHTGRTMPGRRWSEGLHQAVEAKEGVSIQAENQTLASITFQNYFRLYDKLAGMTGTADTEAYEFQQIYNLEVVVIPTNKPNQRQDLPDLVYMTQKEKFEAIVADILECTKRQQPVLVGTISIETSEFLSHILSKQKIPHQVLNAKQHEREAQIVAEAGRPGAVTIATNMAGRGTDIVLGGNLEAEIATLETQDATVIAQTRQAWQKRHQQVLDAGGLHIIGTERHESRRIDNQLRGRSGRQGDPGSTRFYLSLEDNLMRIFISNKMSGLLTRIGLEEGEAITHPWVTRAIENAQRKVEGHHFDIRKQLLEFDDVANDQRRVIYQQRNELMSADDISDTIKEVRDDVLNEVFFQFIPPQSIVEQWHLEDFEAFLAHEFNQPLPLRQWLEDDEHLTEEQLKSRVIQHFANLHEEKERSFGADAMRHLEKAVMLNVLDNHWKEHLVTMDYMRQSIHLRGYAQKDPKQEYKREAFNLFTSMLDSIKRDVVGILTKVEIQEPSDIEAMDQQRRNQAPDLHFEHQEAPMVTQPTAEEGIQAAQEERQPYVREGAKVGRNEPCPCGSGMKFKNCHGKIS